MKEILEIKLRNVLYKILDDSISFGLPPEIDKNKKLDMVENIIINIDSLLFKVDNDL